MNAPSCRQTLAMAFGLALLALTFVAGCGDETPAEPN